MAKLVQLSAADCFCVTNQWHWINFYIYNLHGTCTLIVNAKKNYLQYYTQNYVHKLKKQKKDTFEITYSCLKWQENERFFLKLKR